MHYDDFIPMFENQYPQFPWKEVEVSVNSLSDYFNCMTTSRNAGKMLKTDHSNIHGSQLLIANQPKHDSKGG